MINILYYNCGRNTGVKMIKNILGKFNKNFNVIEKNNYTPFSFIIPNNYTVPNNSKILLIIPCSKEKPYKNSYTHNLIQNTLAHINGIHKVTLSGLYGPVPIEFEDKYEAVTSYDYLLTKDSFRQIALVAGRLALFLDKHKKKFKTLAGYATVEPYRSIIEAAFLNCQVGKIFPTACDTFSIDEFSKTKNLNELKKYLEKNC